MRHILFFIIVVFIGGCSDSISPVYISPALDLSVDWRELDEVEAHWEMQKPEPEIEAIASSGRECKGDGKASRNVTQNYYDYSTFYLISYTNNNGYWQNPVDGFALTYYDKATDIPFLWKSYDNQMSTDVVSRKVRYPSSVRKLSDGRTRVIHKRNRYVTDIEYKEKGQNKVIPAVQFYDENGILICEGFYDCDKYVSGCSYY